MPPDAESLDQLLDHWAIQALGSDALEQAETAAQSQFVRDTLSARLVYVDEAAGVLGSANLDVPFDLIERAAGALEVAAAEGLDRLINPGADEEGRVLAQQAQAAAYRAYGLRRVLPVPSAQNERLFWILKLSALAYVADEWTDLRSWLAEQPARVGPPEEIGGRWEDRILGRVYSAWLRLFRKSGWEDLNGVSSDIQVLREEQAQWESSSLESAGQQAAPKALQLLALYHWARGTELLATYMLQGTPASIEADLDSHFDRAKRSALLAGDPSLDVLIQWLHVASRKMVSGSIWSVAQSVNSRVAAFAQGASQAGMFELLPPQLSALREHGLLDPASRAVVVELPTSGGKTVLAEFRILQALNQFREARGWVAYVAPTRALVSQLTRRLRRDLDPLDVVVEQLSAAVEIDELEQEMLSEGSDRAFDVLVATPEKLSMVIRNDALAGRPLALLVMDEAQNIEDEQRGLRIELLLATVKNESSTANFMLLMPYVPNASDLTSWLDPQSGRTISLGTSQWTPNDRVMGTFGVRARSGRGNWTVEFDVRRTTPRTASVSGRTLEIPSNRPLDVPFSQATGLAAAAALALRMSGRGTSIAVGRTIEDTWRMARRISARSEPASGEREAIDLVQRFLREEVSADFELVQLLERRVAVHHAGLSDEARNLVEWLAERGDLGVLCATTTIAQGINFPVSSVFLASRFIAGAGAGEMNHRQFMNLAGRAGRVGQEPLGVVGLWEGANEASARNSREYLDRAHRALVSRLLTMMNELRDRGEEFALTAVERDEQWADFRSFVAHAWNETRELTSFLSSTEQVLRGTFGYTVARSEADDTSTESADLLLTATRRYAEVVADQPGVAALADATGFDPAAIQGAIGQLRGLGSVVNNEAWSVDRLFSPQESILPELVGVMMRIPQLREPLQDIAGPGHMQARVADLVRAWVSGATFDEIARSFFWDPSKGDYDATVALTDASRALYRSIALSTTWGLSGLSRLPGSGLDFDSMSDEDRRVIQLLPAMVYYGVSSEPAVLMRMNLVPRSIAQPLGEAFMESVGEEDRRRPTVAREFLSELSDASWEQARPIGSQLAGSDYRQVWEILSGAR